jgi:hypothetical protein
MRLLNTNKIFEWVRELNSNLIRDIEVYYENWINC